MLSPIVTLFFFFLFLFLFVLYYYRSNAHISVQTLRRNLSPTFKCHVRTHKRREVWVDSVTRYSIRMLLLPFERQEGNLALAFERPESIKIDRTHYRHHCSNYAINIRTLREFGFSVQMPIPTFKR